jgi:hypothetical protein
VTIMTRELFISGELVWLHSKFTQEQDHAIAV